MSLGQSVALLFTVSVDPSKGIEGMQRFENSVRGNVSNIISAFPGGNFLAPFLNEITRTSSKAKTDLDSVGRSAEGAGASLFSTIGPAGAAGVGLASVGVAAVGATVEISKFVKTQVDYIDRIREMSVLTGIHATTLSTIGVAATRVGLDLNSLNTSFGIYLKNLSEAAHGNEATAKTFTRFGIDAKKGIQDPDQAIKDLLTRLGQIPNEAERLDAAFKLAGKSGKNLALIADEMRSGFAEFQREAQKLGVVVGEEDVEKAHQFEVAWRSMGLQTQGILLQLAKEAMPAVQNAIKELSEDIGRNGNAWQQLGRDMGSVVSETVSVIKALVAVGDELDDIYKRAFLAGVELRKALTPQIPDTSYVGRFLESQRSGPDTSEWRKGAVPVDMSKVPFADPKAVWDASPDNPKNKKPGPSDTGGIGDVPHKAKHGGGGSHGMSQAEFEKQSADIELKVAQDHAREIENIYKASYDVRLIDFKEYKAAQLTLAESLRDAELKIVQKEREAAEKEKDHKKREIDLQKANERELKIRNDFADKKRGIEVEEIEHERQRQLDREQFRYDITSAALQSQISLYEDAAGQRVFIAGQQLEHARAFQRLDFDAKEKNLREQLRLSQGREEEETKINRQLELLAEERATAEKRASQRIIDAYMAEARAREGFRRDILQIEESIKQDQLNTHAAVIESMKMHGVSVMAVRKAEFQLQKDSLDAEHANRVEGIKQQAQDAVDRLVEEGGSYEQLLALEKKYHDLLLEEDKNYQQQRQNIEDEATKELTLKGQLKDIFINSIPDLSPKQAGVNALATAFKGLKSAILESTAAFIAHGASIKQVFQQQFAAVATAIAQEAELQGLKQAALAISSLAEWDLRGAAMHGAASAAWFALAGGVALAGRAIAPSSTGAGAVAGQNFAPSQSTTRDSGPRVITENASFGAPHPQRIDLHVHITGQVDNAKMVDAVAKAINPYDGGPHGDMSRAIVNVIHHSYNNNNERLNGVLQDAYAR